MKSIDLNRPTLFYDGHSTHISVRLIEIVCESNVMILKLPLHTSHVPQPLDLSVFKRLKTSWDKKLVTCQRKNIGVRLLKNSFLQWIDDIWRDLNTEIIKNGFKKAGTYPFAKIVV